LKRIEVLTTKKAALDRAAFFIFGYIDLPGVIEKSKRMDL
jgi:hypothetical protein